MTDRHLLSHMTGPEVSAYVAQASMPMVILPVGATEQHGAHGALGTDSIAAEVIAQRVAQRVDARVAPTVPYGYSATHRHHPGTVTLAATTLVDVLTEVTDGLFRQGFALVLMLSGHRGNDPAMSLAASTCRARWSDGGGEDRYVLWMSYQDANRGRLHEVVGDESRISAADVAYGADGHGGMVETSIALVQTDAAWRPEAAAAPDRTLADAARSFSFHATHDIEEITDAGIFGNPVGASRALGERAADATAARIADDLHRYWDRFVAAGRA